MARRTNKPYNNTDNQPWICPQTQSDWYKGTSPGTYVPVGILYHSTGCVNPYLKRYVAVSDNVSAETKALWNKRLGVGWGTDWNHKSGVNAGLHFWVGKDGNNQVASVFCGGKYGGDFSSNMDNTCTRRGWGCASGSNGSCNGMRVVHPKTGKIVQGVWLQFEMCEDNLTNKQYYEECIEEAIAISAYLCDRYGINPIGTVKTASGLVVPTLNNHFQSYLQRLGSNHYDIFNWSDKWYKCNHSSVFTDKVMVDIRERVVKAMGKQPTPTPTPTPTKDFPDPPFLIKIKAKVPLYSDDKGTKKIGEVKDVGVYTIVQVNEKTDYGKLKSGIGWLNLKDDNIYVRGDNGEMRFSDLETLSRGSTGADVRMLQAVVIPQEIDGSFGKRTEEAVKVWQKAHNCVTDGICGEETWKTIWAVAKKDQ